MNLNIIENIHEEIKNDIQNKQYQQAIEKYKNIIDLKPLNVNDYIKEFGEFYEGQKMFYEAVACYVIILKTNNYNISQILTLTNQIGNCYYNLKVYKLAIHYWKKILQVKEIPEVYNNIAVCYIALNEYIESEKFYLKSYNSNQNMSSCNGLGETYYYLT